MAKPSGAEIAAGEVIAEIETEKALAEVTAPETGILLTSSTLVRTSRSSP